MPPIVALVLCICFVVYLLKLDRRQFPEASRGLWIPTIWMIIASTKAIGTWFGAEVASLEEGSSLDRNVLLALCFVAIAMVVKRKLDLTGSLREIFWLIALVVFMLISIFWSEVPFISLKRWIREVIAIVMGFLVLTESDPKAAIASVARRTIYILIPLSVVLTKYFPQYGIDYVPWSGARMWVGVTDQKNEMGQLTSLAVFFILWSLLKRFRDPSRQKIRFLNLADTLVLIIALYLTRGSDAGYSATSLVMLAVALVLFGGLFWLKKKGKVVRPAALKAYFAVLIIYGTLTPLMGRLPALDITSSIGRDSTLTFRTRMWERFVPMAMSKPVLGHGVGGFWTSERLALGFPAHNGYLEIILTLGFVGLFLMGIFLISMAGKAQAALASDFDWGVLWACWLTMALLNNVAESSLNSFSNFLMTIPIWMTIAHHRSE